MTLLYIEKKNKKSHLSAHTSPIMNMFQLITSRNMSMGSSRMLVDPVVNVI